MIKGIYTSAAGMIAREISLDSVANNLANASTTGFKGDHRTFRTMIDNQLVQPGPWGKPTRIGDLENGLYTDFSNGSFKHTEVPTQMAINGDGFFKVRDNETNQEFFTRNGKFNVNADHELVTMSGHNVIDENGNYIQIHGNQLLVNAEGELYEDGVHTSKLSLVRFDHPDALQKEGKSLFSNPHNMIPQEVEGAEVMQGYLEESNINIVKEMVDMIMLNRMYETSQRVLTTQDETLKRAVNSIGRYSSS